MKALPCLAMLAALSLLPAAQAQTQKIKPGLWEQSVTMKSQSGQIEGAMAMAQAQMEAMSPEQRKMVEQMMAGHGVGMGNKLTTMRMCISKEQSERDEMPQNEHCKQQSVQRSGNTLKLKFSCEGPPATSGEGEFTLKSSTAYSGKALVNTVVQGRAEQMTMDMNGTWLSADCGTLQPASR